ncbi:ubiquitin fusion degradation protein [Entophlyctis helioformis]|nr:ubiquitin fusion degradation protein [Entophlyctis helioformis]
MFNGEYDDNGFPPSFGRRPQREFKEMYRCFSISMLPGNEKPAANFGGKVFLPPSALAKLSSLHIEYPMLFEIRNDAAAKTTHAGVLEFTADEGRIYIPNWMMQSLLLQEGQIVQIKSTSLPLGKFVKIQPQSVDFLDITDPKAVLEQAMRSFSTLTPGDIITISYNSSLFDILVMEIKPEGPGISIIETDLEVDFAAPLGYKEPERPKQNAGSKQPQNATSIEEHTVKAADSFHAFKGSGQRLSGKAEVTGSYGAKQTTGTEASESNATGTAPPALRLPPGKLFFGYPVVPVKGKDGTESAKAAEGPHFAGAGQTLRSARKSNSKPASSTDVGAAGGSSSK